MNILVYPNCRLAPGSQSLSPCLIAQATYQMSLGREGRWFSSIEACARAVIIIRGRQGEELSVCEGRRHVTYLRTAARLRRGCRRRSTGRSLALFFNFAEVGEAWRLACFGAMHGVWVVLRCCMRQLAGFLGRRSARWGHTA